MRSTDKLWIKTVLAAAVALGVLSTLALTGATPAASAASKPSAASSASAATNASAAQAGPRKPVFVIYYLWWSADHWRDRLGTNYPHTSASAPPPAGLGGPGRGARFAP